MICTHYVLYCFKKKCVHSVLHDVRRGQPGTERRLRVAAAPREEEAVAGRARARRRLLECREARRQEGLQRGQLRRLTKRSVTSYREPLKGSSQVVRICGGKNCVCLPEVGEQNATFSPNFTQPGKSLSEVPCMSGSLGSCSHLPFVILTAVSAR